MVGFVGGWHEAAIVCVVGAGIDAVSLAIPVTVDDDRRRQRWRVLIAVVILIGVVIGCCLVQVGNRLPGVFSLRHQWQRGQDQRHDQHKDDCPGPETLDHGLAHLLATGVVYLAKLAWNRMARVRACLESRVWAGSLEIRCLDDVPEQLAASQVPDVMTHEVQELLDARDPSGMVLTIGYARSMDLVTEKSMGCASHEASLPGKNARGRSSAPQIMERLQQIVA